jgi:hypothetical protein
MKVLLGILIGMFGIPFMLILVFMWNVAGANVDAGWKFADQMAQEGFDGAKRMALIDYSQNECKIELPHALQIALRRYSEKHPDELQKAKDYWTAEAGSVGEYKAELHQNKCAISRKAVNEIRNMFVF